MNLIPLRRKDMKKIIAVVCLLVFVQFTAVYAFSPELLLKDFTLDKEDSSEGDIRPFSLKTDYSSEINIPEPGLFSGIAQGSDADLKSLKSKRLWSFVGAAGFIGLGAYLFYLFGSWEEKPTYDQFGQEKPHTETNTLTQWGYFIGGLVCLGISAYLISSGVRFGKAIKEYEAELKAAAAYSLR
jgi:hypothetical protein